MTKTTNFLTGLVLAISFVVATHVRAELITFAFENANEETESIDGAPKDSLLLTAEDNGAGGVEFVFSSSWTDGKDNGPGKINPQNESRLYFYGVTDVFDFGGHIDKGETGMAYYKDFTNLKVGVGFVPTEGFEWNELTKQNEILITLNYKTDQGWDAFESLVTSNDFGFSAHIGAINSNGDSGKFITTGDMHTAEGSGLEEDDYHTPEPATLAVWGFGLAGLGLASRRRK